MKNMKQLTDNQKRIKERDNKIKELLDKNYRYFEIEKELNLSKTVIINTARKFGVDYMKDKKEYYNKLLKKVKYDLYYNKLNYNIIIKKYNLTKKDLQKFNMLKFKLLHEFHKLRNEEMGNKYENGIVARKLTSKKPKYIKTICGVYGVVSNKLKIYKYPKIKRGLKGLFYDKKIINLIEKNKNKLTHQEISNKLNKKNYKTLYGTEFKTHHVNNILTKIRNNKHKIKNIDLKSYRPNKYK